MSAERDVLSDRRECTADRAWAARYSVAEFVAYLQRIGYHEAARRVSVDRQVIVLRSPDASDETEATP